MTLQYRKKKTGQIAIVTGVHWESEIEKPDEHLMPTKCLDFDDVVICYQLPSVDNLERLCSKADFLRTHEPIRGGGSETKMDFSCMRCPFFSPTAYCLKVFKPDRNLGCEFGRKVFEMNKLIKEWTFLNTSKVVPD